MIVLDYRLSQRWDQRAQRHEPSEVSRFDLNTSFFQGDQIFLVDAKDFSFVGFDIPLLESARSLIIAVLQVAGGAESESSHPLDLDCHLEFIRTDDAIVISSSLTGDKARCDVASLNTAVISYGERLLRDVLQRFPKLRTSTALFEWYPVQQLGLESLFQVQQ